MRNAHRKISYRVKNKQPSQKRRKHRSPLSVNAFRRIRHLVKPSWKNQKRWYQLFLAVMAKDVSRVKILLAAGANVNRMFFKEVLVLHCAARVDDLEMVKVLVDAGADVNKQTVDGKSALHLAVMRGNEAMINFLLDHKSSINAKNKDGNTPLHCAVKEYRGYDSDTAIIKILLERGVDPNEPNKDGSTPLHSLLLACDDTEAAVKLFLEHRADVMKTNGLGETIVHYAATIDDSKALDLILDSGADVDLKDEYGNTPLHLACYHSLPENIRLLVARGAAVNVKDNLNDTPLYMCVIDGLIFEPETNSDAFHKDRLQAIQLMLDLGSDINQKITSDNKTIFEIAIEWEDWEVCKMMIKHVAKVEAQEKKQLLDAFNVTVINRHLESKIYYETCKAELTAMKEMKIDGSFISYLSVLVNPLHMVMGYARNRKLVQAFKTSNYETAFPMYQAQLRAKFDEGIERQNLCEKSAEILSSTLQFADPSHVAFVILARMQRS